MEKTVGDFERAERAFVEDINDVLAVNQEFPITYGFQLLQKNQTGGGGCFRRVQTNPEDCPRSGVEHPAGSPRRCSGLLVISEAMGDFLCPVKLPAMCDRQTGPEGAEADAPKTREKKILKII